MPNIRISDNLTVGYVQECLKDNLGRDSLYLVLEERTWFEWATGVPKSKCVGKMMRIESHCVHPGAFARFRLSTDYRHF